MSDDKSLEMRALYKLEKLTDEVYEPRWIADKETVEECIELFEELYDADTPIDTSEIDSILRDLRQIKTLVDGAPSYRIDNEEMMELKDDYEQLIVKHDLLD